MANVGFNATDVERRIRCSIAAEGLENSTCFNFVSNLRSST